MNFKFALSRQGKYIHGQPVVALDSTFYIFGGMIQEKTYKNKNIAAFNTIAKEWKKMGDMKQARAGHGVFIQLDAFVVVGGVSEDSQEKEITELTTERCILIDGAINCTVVHLDPIGEYFYFPEMIRVPYDYCPK